MKKISILLFTLFGTLTLYSQNTQTSSDSDKIYTIVQQKPVFNGDVSKFLSDSVKYPEDARQNNAQGTVYVKFVIEKNGSVSKVELLRGVTMAGGESLNKEALRVVSSMPKWQPGVDNGHPVRVQYMVPIHFILKKPILQSPFR